MGVFWINKKNNHLMLKKSNERIEGRKKNNLSKNILRFSEAVNN